MKVIYLSGGKNSTAMLFRLIELNEIEREDKIVFVNTGIEFKENLNFINRLNSTEGLEVTVIKPEKPLYYYCFKKPVTRGTRKGQLGYGVPTCIGNRRWCCKVLKREPFFQYLKQLGVRNVTLMTGYTVNEEERARKSLFSREYGRRYGIKVKSVFPLIEWEWDDSKCFNYCKERGILNPLYRYFKRFGCRFCPCYSIQTWRILFKHFPQYFRQAEVWEEKSIKLTGRTFRSDYTLKELRRRFSDSS